jgi:CubicO group peptidase (beta-lactamase class C family)
MDAGRLTAWLDGQVASHAFSGVALAWRDGAPTFRYAGGIADRGHGIPIASDTRFAVASVTKLPVAIAALRLVDRDLVGLDQPVIDILPPAHRTAAMRREHTLHHLLSHTSGLPNYHDDAAQTWASFTSCWDRIPTYHVRRPADMLPLFATLPADFAPGERYAYSDANFILVGLVIEAITGRPFSEVVAEEVFVPAGMTATAFEDLDRAPARLATGYLTADGPYEDWRSNVFSVPAGGMPDGGLITTAEDLAHLMDALLDGRLLAERTLAAMTSAQGPPADSSDRYGYGCELVVEDGVVTVLGHSGTDPGVTAELNHYCASGTTVVVVCNQDRGAWSATKRILEELGLEDPRAASSAP